MRHASEETLKQISGLLTAIRGLGSLTEKRTGIFYARGVAFLHFHEDPAGIFADVKCQGNWERFPANTSAEQQRILKAVGTQLEEKRSRVGNRKPIA